MLSLHTQSNSHTLMGVVCIKTEYKLIYYANFIKNQWYDGMVKENRDTNKHINI